MPNSAIVMPRSAETARLQPLTVVRVPLADGARAWCFPGQRVLVADSRLTDLEVEKSLDLAARHMAGELVPEVESPRPTLRVLEGGAR